MLNEAPVRLEAVVESATLFTVQAVLNVTVCPSASEALPGTHTTVSASWGLVGVSDALERVGSVLAMVVTGEVAGVPYDVPS